MTTLSSLLGIISVLLPIVLDALSRKGAPIGAPSRIKELKKAETAHDVQVAWAKHDADLERLLS